MFFITVFFSGLSSRVSANRRDKRDKTPRSCDLSLRILNATLEIFQVDGSVHLHGWQFAGGRVRQKLGREPLGELVAGGRQAASVVGHVSVFHWEKLDFLKI